MQVTYDCGVQYKSTDSNFFEESTRGSVEEISWAKVTQSKVHTRYMFINVRIYPYPMHEGHISLRGTTAQIQPFSKSNPVGRVHGSNPWVGRRYLVGQADPIRDMNCSHGSGWVGS